MEKIKGNVPKIRFPGFESPWEQRKVGEWGSFYYGHSCPKWSVTDDASTPCIRYGELYTKFGTKIDKVFSYTNMPTDKLRFSKGTEVLIPRVGEDPKDYNHCTWLSMSGVAIGEMISVFNTEQNPLFTATMFNATLQKEFASRVEGGSVTNLYYEKLKNIDVLYPSLEEQEKVASFFEQIDNLITIHQRKLEHLQDNKKGLLQKIFPKEGEKLPEIRFPGFTDPWEQRKLNEIADVLDGDRGNNYPNSNEFQEKGHTMFLSASNVTMNGFMFDDIKYITEEKSNSMGNGKLLLDDIVLTSRGSIGHIAWYDKNIQQQVPFARINSGMLILRSKDFAMPCFVSQFLKSPLGKKQIDLISFGSAQPQLTKKDVSNYVVSIPSDRSEQKKLGVFFDNLDNLITLHKRKLNHLQQQKKGLLQQMFI